MKLENPEEEHQLANRVSGAHPLWSCLCSPLHPMVTAGRWVPLRDHFHLEHIFGEGKESELLSQKTV